MEDLVRVDHHIFYYLNRVWTNSAFDYVLPLLTDLHKNPIALGIFAVLLIVWLALGRLQSLKCILVLIFVISISDALSHRVFKPFFQRERPQYLAQTQVLTEKQAGWSFPSSHATNCFAAAATVGSFFPPFRAYLMAFAALVAYSRVYVGVHYPLDVLVGALLGLLLAYAAYWIWLGLVERYEILSRTKGLLKVEKKFGHAFHDFSRRDTAIEMAQRWNKKGKKGKRGKIKKKKKGEKKTEKT